MVDGRRLLYMTLWEFSEKVRERRKEGEKERRKDREKERLRTRSRKIEKEKIVSCAVRRRGETSVILWVGLVAMLRLVRERKLSWSVCASVWMEGVGMLSQVCLDRQ